MRKSIVAIRKKHQSRFRAVRTAKIEARLAYLRGEIVAERVSYGEIAELRSLVEHIDPRDILLLEWAGVPESCAARRRKKGT
jgi:hypothetical protein